MLAKLTPKNQLTLPKAVLSSCQGIQYFNVTEDNGRIVLTPACINRADTVREELLDFYDFPAEHWPHLRTTNPIESTFATVKLRTAKTRGYLSRKTLLTMIFKLCRSAEKRWRRLQGYRRCGEVIMFPVSESGTHRDREIRES